MIMYFSYHATAHRLIDAGKLTGYYYTDNHNGIKPALVLVFDDFRHPLMPIREYKWNEYAPLLAAVKEVVK